MKKTVIAATFVAILAVVIYVARAPQADTRAIRKKAVNDET